MKSPRYLYLMHSILVAAVSGAPVLAQQQKERVLEEVIVTAERRETSLQDVAISMTVLSQEQISNANMTNSADLAALTPSLSITPRFGPENASFSIRGFTKELRTTASVGVYFAEVVAPRGQTVQTSGDGAGPGMMFDLQNVQVLKGPQGTLFGRNTTGGAILFEPNKPTDEFEGYLELTAGDFGLRQQQGVLNIPVNDRFKLRFALDRKRRDGYLKNITGIGADKLADVDYTAGRASFVIDITESLENYFIVHYTDSETKGHTSRLFACNTESSPDEVPLVLVTGPGCQQQLAEQRATGQDGFFDVVSTVATPITAIKDLRVINKTTWALTDNVAVKSILGYTHLETKNGSDVHGTQFTETQAMLVGLGLPGGVADPSREFVAGAAVINPDAPVTSQESLLAELQVQGTSFDGRLQWQGGLYFENSRPDGPSGTNSPIIISCEIATIEERDSSKFNCFDPTAGVVGGAWVGFFETEYFNRAVFTQATYDFFDWFSLTAGARYTWDYTRGETVFTLHNFAGNVQQEPIVSVESESQASEAPTGLIELKFRPFADVMVYGKYVRGYRQGGANMAADIGIQTYEPEMVDTYEIGAKTSFNWPIPIRFNVAAFDNDFTDMQLQAGYISQNKGPTTAIFNAGSAEIRGFEADAFIQVFEGLTLGLAYSRLLTELLEQDNNQAKIEEAAGPVSGATFSPNADVGDTLPYAQEKAYTASLNYRLPLPSAIGEIDIGTTYIYTGEQRASATSATPFHTLRPYEVWNVNLGWKDMFGLPVDLSLFGTNIRDKRYVTYVSGAYNSLGFDGRQMGAPRMAGARLRYNF